jgi:hypothetical protein
MAEIDGATEPDLVLSLAPPVPRRSLATPDGYPRPACTPPPVPRPVPPPVPPPVHDTTVAVAPAESVGDDAAHRGMDRRWWVSTAISTVVHVVFLTVLALIVQRPDDVLRPRPILISRTTEEPEPLPFVAPDDDVAIETVEPAAEDPAEALVEPAQAFVDRTMSDAAAAAFESDVGPPEGLAELEPDGILAHVGGAGVGQGAGGFGGEIGRRLARAGAKTGDIQVSLAWENFNDLDLHVVAPSGERIYFGHRTSACKGMLDVDMNAMGPTTREPVENVFWPAKEAPRGEYEVFVQHYARHDRVDETAFVVHVLVNGVRRRYTGSVRAGDSPMAVTRFVKRPPGAPTSDDFVE